MHWDLFCRVIDNFGDIGVCWRLAADLGARGESVRLWVDDASALAWMAPQGAPGVQVVGWRRRRRARRRGDRSLRLRPAAGLRRARWRGAQRPPLWINLEYLSAEAYVKRSHGLRSPQLAGPGRGLDKWFFYPGFEPGTGGLLREPGLMDERRRFDGRAWLQSRGLAPRPGERVVSLFCYASAPVGDLLQALADAPTLLLLTPGAASAHAAARRRLRCLALPWFSQGDYDRLLWACDLNFVRGEDSFVRAHVGRRALRLADLSAARRGACRQAGRLARPDAGRCRAGAGRGPAPPVARLERPAARSGRAAAGRGVAGELALRWRQRLLAQPDLATQLLGFVAERR